jgi:gamma-glutamyl:cysteine ligase YbdK (ATP-grasp superfamily)
MPAAARTGELADEQAPLGLFEGYGVELEYMIVDAAGFDVRPIADVLIERESGAAQNEIERGAFAWSNELARHVIEIKTNGPAPQLGDLAQGFQAEVRRITELLLPEGACLMPGAMHPWMDPERDFELWPHGDREIYTTFDRIFDCRGHGWANLQSAHLNLPFADDDEFGRLHAAMRALLPLLPALAASSPYLGGRDSGRVDNRLDVYATNARRVPSVSGAVIPEPVFTRRDYEALLERIYRDLAPLDPAGVLRHEWVNARGCIARFDRMALEIRVLDVQECPRADLAIAAAVSASLRALCDPDARHQARLRSLTTPDLAQLLQRTVAAGERARVDSKQLLSALGLPDAPVAAGAVWRSLNDRDLRPAADAAVHLPTLETILEQGCLARRMRSRVGANPSPEALRELCRELCNCLVAGRLLEGKA